MANIRNMCLDMSAHCRLRYEYEEDINPCDYLDDIIYNYVYEYLQLW